MKQHELCEQVLLLSISDVARVLMMICHVWLQGSLQKDDGRLAFGESDFFWDVRQRLTLFLCVVLLALLQAAHACRLYLTYHGAFLCGLETPHDAVGGRG
jgi:hypothetical protein